MSAAIAGSVPDRNGVAMCEEWVGAKRDMISRSYFSVAKVRSSPSNDTRM